MCSQPSCDKWARSPDAGWCPWLCRANAGARRTQKVLALAQARKVDVILVTELTPWGRSARFAARSLTCFKFRFVSSPLYTSERNDGHEDRFCRDANYNPSAVRPPTGRELWWRWQFVYTGNARVPCWIVRVPKDIIWGHMGIMERQFHCHVRRSLSFAFPADIRRQGHSYRAGSRSKRTGCATIKSRQTALTGKNLTSVRWNPASREDEVLIPPEIESLMDLSDTLHKKEGGWIPFCNGAFHPCARTPPIEPVEPAAVPRPCRAVAR